MTAIQCEDVWKIYGPRAAEAMDAVRKEGLDKDKVFQRFGCVIGVAGVSFAVGEGEIFCVMGLSGSGKSTLVRHINRLIEPTAGHIRIHGDDIGQKTTAELRRIRAEKIGMVFQHMALFPHRTVIDNVAYGLEVRGIDKPTRYKQARDKLAMVQLDGWEDRYPDELSGGMQQRVGLARALAADPDILLMDEPFSALDPMIRRQLQDQFLELARAVNKTTLFITHDLDEAIRLGHRIAIMKDGKFSQVGTPEEIVTRPADGYVANFVQGISRLQAIYAHTVVQSSADYAERGGRDLGDCPEIRKHATLNEMIDLLLRTDRPLAVVNDDGSILGVVTARDVLQAIRGNHQDATGGLPQPKAS